MVNLVSVEENLDTVANEMASAKIEKNSLVVLPECFAYFGGKDKGQLAVAETKGEGEIQRRLSALAAQYQCYLVSGTFPVKTNSSEKFSAACMLFGPNGDVLKFTCSMYQLTTTRAVIVNRRQPKRAARWLLLKRQ